MSTPPGLLRFRPATLRDRPWLFALYEDAMRPHIAQIWGWDPVFQEEDFQAVFCSSQTQVVETDGGPAGYLQVDLTKDETYLRMLILHPDFRSRGLGARVLRALLRASLERGQPLTFRVFRINSEARRFYEREGCRVVAEEEAFHLMAYGGDGTSLAAEPGIERFELGWARLQP